MKLAEKRLLQFLLHNSAIQQNFLSHCTRHDFAGLASERIFEALLAESRQGKSATFEMLHRQFAGEPEQDMLSRLQMEEVAETLTEATAGSFLDALRIIRLTARKQELAAKIEEAAGRKDEGMLDQLIAERVQIDRELGGLSR
jgi:hypothetical protein